MPTAATPKSREEITESVINALQKWKLHLHSNQIMIADESITLNGVTYSTHFWQVHDAVRHDIATHLQQPPPTKCGLKYSNDDGDGTVDDDEDDDDESVPPLV